MVAAAIKVLKQPITLPKLHMFSHAVPPILAVQLSRVDKQARVRSSAAQAFALAETVTDVALDTVPEDIQEAAPKKKKVFFQRKRRSFNFTMNKTLKVYLKGLWIGVYVLSAIAAMQLSFLWRPAAGVYLTAISLILLLALALSLDRARKLAISAAIIPTTMLVSLSLPQHDVFARSAVYYILILLLSLLYGYMFTMNEPHSVMSLGKKYIILLPLMVVIGQVLGALGFVVLRGQYPYHGTPIALVASTAVVFGFSEELLFRGLLQQQALKVVHPVAAVVITSLAYAVVFTVHGSVLPFVFALIAGSVLSTIYYFKQNLLLTTATNVAMKLIFVGLMATFVLH
jgi:membrane protease YdiL (CAAX protease family)